MCNYKQVCHYVQVYVSICRYVNSTDPEIPADTYTYIQYLHIMTYILIPAIPAHTCNTYSYCHTYIYLQYLHIHAIPTYNDIHTHTCNTYSYMWYLCILSYLLIPAIPTDTYKIYIPAYNCVYLHIHANTCAHMHIIVVYLQIHVDTCTYMHIPHH